jgi:hypothetical protein
MALVRKKEKGVSRLSIFPREPLPVVIESFVCRHLVQIACGKTGIIVKSAPDFSKRPLGQPLMSLLGAIHHSICDVLAGSGAGAGEWQ